MTGTLVLLSGGMDSTVLLADTIHRAGGRPVHAIAVDYGQRHAREIGFAALIADHYSVPFDVIDLTGYGLHVTSALTSTDVAVPEGHYADASMAATVVPNRNAVLLMVAVGIAASRNLARVVTAVHAGDHPVYPDCRPEFILAANNAALLGTDGQVSIEAPFVNITKTTIATLGARHGAPFHLTWSCYQGGTDHCGRCGTCVERKEAFVDSGIPDPTTYALPEPS